MGAATTIDGRRTSRATSTVPGGVLVLLAALANAAVNQGGFYWQDQRFTLLLLAVAGVAVVLHAPLSRHEICTAPVLGAGALTASALLSAIAAGDAGDAFPVVALLAGLAVTVVAVRRMPLDARGQLVHGLLLVGAVVAMTGWAGVTFRREPFALMDGGLWRAASTITYANGTAGFLAPLALLALSRSNPSRRERLTSLVLVTGLTATLSRGGLAAFALGVGLLVAVRPDRRALVAGWWPVAAGVAVAMAGLAPGMSADAARHPLMAIAGLVAGAGIVLMPRRAGAGRVPVAAVLLAGAALVASIVVSGALSGRISLASPDRADEQAATLRLAREHPVLGVGPGNFSLAYVSHAGIPVTAEFAHDEYLQLLAEQGVVGAAALAAAGAVLATALVRSRRRVDLALWAPAVAGLVALAVHSGLDFLWRMPAIPLLGAVLVGLALPVITPDTKEQS